MLERQTTTGWVSDRPDSAPAGRLRREEAVKNESISGRPEKNGSAKARAAGIQNNLPSVGYRELPQVTVRFRGRSDSDRELAGTEP